MRKYLIVILSLLSYVASAQSPELKNVMPNNWEKLTRLSAQEEKKFLSQQQVINDIENI